MKNANRRGVPAQPGRTRYRMLWSKGVSGQLYRFDPYDRPIVRGTPLRQEQGPVEERLGVPAGRTKRYHALQRQEGV